MYAMSHIAPNKMDSAICPIRASRPINLPAIKKKSPIEALTAEVSPMLRHGNILLKLQPASLTVINSCINENDANDISVAIAGPMNPIR